MKNKILKILVLFVIIVPCIFGLISCKDNKESKAIDISIQLKNNKYQLVDNMITITYGGKVSLTENDFVVVATLSNNKTQVISVKKDNADGYELESTIPTDDITPINEYPLTFSYQGLEKVVTVRVVKANVDLTNVKWDYTAPLTYNKLDQEVKLINLPEGVTVEYQGEFRAKNVGIYSAVAVLSYEDSEHYNVMPAMTLVWEIKKAILNINLDLPNYVYDGQVKTIESSQFEDQLPEDVIVNTIQGDLNKIDAGTYNLDITFKHVGDDKSNYIVPNITESWIISPATYTNVGTVSLKQNYDYTYDGLEKIVELNLNGLDSNVSKKLIVGDKAINAGVYSVTVELNYIGLSTNYDSAQSIILTDVWEIKRAPLTITANDKNIVYGDAVTHNDFSASGLVNSETVSVLNVENVEYKIGDDGVCDGSVGQYDIDVTGVQSSNYEITYAKGKLTIEAKPINVIVKDVILTYGDDVPDLFEIESDGLVLGDKLSEFMGETIYSHSYEKGSSIGNYPVEVKGISNDNYEITFVAGNIVVEKAELNLTVKNASIIYGGNPINNGYEVLGFVNDDDVSVINGEPIYTYGEYHVGANVGNYTIQLTGLSALNYEINIVDGELNVKPASLMVKANNHEVTYGDEADNNGYTTEGFVNGETELVLTGEIQYLYYVKDTNTLYTKGNNVGEYDIVISGFESNNYEITYQKGVLNVRKKVLTVKPKDICLTYGEPISGSFELEYIGLIGEDVLDGVANFVHSYTQESPVGTYFIQLSGLESTNYEITYNDGLIIVSPAKLSIVVKDKTIQYGEDPDNNGFDVVGLLNGDLVDDVIDTKDICYNFSEYVKLESGVGIYDISVSGLKTNKNYEIEKSLKGRLVVEPKEIDVSNLEWQNLEDNIYSGLAIKPILKTVPEGLSVSYTYRVYGSIEEVNPINVGNYTAFAVFAPINENYNVVNSVSNLDFEIVVKGLTVTANNHEITYGENASNNGYKIEGFVNDENEAVLTGEIEYLYYVEDTEIPYIKGNGVGLYDIVISGFSSNNYMISYVKGKMTVSPKNIEISPKNIIITYGDEVPTTCEISDVELIGNDKISDFDGDLEIVSCGYEQGSIASMNGYQFTIGGLSNVNYNIIYKTGKIIVNPKLIVLKPNDVTINYGAEATDNGFVVEGLVNGDVKENIITDTIEYEFVDYVAGVSGVGEYVIQITNSPYLGNNYSLTKTTGKLYVEKASVGSFDNVKLKVDELTYNGTEQIIAESIDDFEGVPIGVKIGSISGNVAKDVKFGGYKVVVQFIVDDSGNYEEFDAKTIELSWVIALKRLTVTVNDVFIEYGEEAVDNGFTALGFVEGEDESVLKGSQRYNFGGYVSGSDVGEYEITISDVYSNNYSITCVSGKLVVNKASLYITDICWNEEMTLKESTNNLKSFELTVKYTGANFEFAVLNAEKFDVKYYVNANDTNAVEVDNVALSEIGVYNIIAELTLNSENVKNYNITSDDGKFIIELDLIINENTSDQ